MAEWSIAPVLKTGNGQPFVSSNLTASAMTSQAAASAALGPWRPLLLEQLRRWARRLRQDALTLWFACRHPATPWYAKALGAFVVAYALSPIDLIPDFIPILGFLDEMLLLPALIWLVVRMLPAPVLEASRADAQRWFDERRNKPRSLAGAVLIGTIWLLALGACAYLLFREPGGIG